MVFGHYAAALPVRLFVPSTLWSESLKYEDAASLAAVGLLGFAWARARLGYATDVNRAVTRTWVAVSVLIVVIFLAFVHVFSKPIAGAVGSPFDVVPVDGAGRPLIGLGALAALIVAFGQAFSAGCSEFVT